MLESVSKHVKKGLQRASDNFDFYAPLPKGIT